MKKNLKKILFCIIISFIVIYSVIILKDKIQEEKRESGDIKYCNITIGDEGNVIVKETLKVEIEKTTNEFRYINIEPTIYCNNMDEKFMKDIKVSMDGNIVFDFTMLNQFTVDELISMGYNEDSNFYKVSENKIEILALSNEEHCIEIEYILNPQNINQYSNISILKLARNKNLSEYKVFINCPKKVNILEANNKYVKINNIKENYYEIDLVDTNKIIDKEFIEIKLDNNLISKTNKLDKEYNFINKLADEKNFTFKYLFIFVIMTLILFIITMLLTRRHVIYRETIKNTNIVLEPIFAEFIIDGKIGTKELIMSCIVDLIYKKNIEIVEESETIRIKNLNNVTPYERKIVDLIFDRCTELSFTEFKKMFYINHVRTIKFNKKLKTIKNEITEKFFNDGIYSRIGERILKYIKIISLAFILNFIPLTMSITKELENCNIMYLEILLILISAVILNIKPREQIYLEELYFDTEKLSISNVLVIVILAFIEYVVVLIEIFESNILTCSIVLLTLIINIISYKKSNIHYLTKKGTIEYNKANALKKYIIDYSLMDQKEINDVIIWDRYLAYACAFGISTKITEKIDGDIIEINDFLKKIDNL